MIDHDEMPETEAPVDPWSALLPGQELVPAYLTSRFAAQYRVIVDVLLAEQDTSLTGLSYDEVAAQSAEQGVVGAVVHGEYLVAGGLFVWGVHADARAFVAAVGQRGQVEMSGGPVQGIEDMLTGQGQPAVSKHRCERAEP